MDKVYNEQNLPNNGVEAKFDQLKQCKTRINIAVMFLSGHQALTFC